MSDLLSVPEDLTLSFSGKKKRSVSPNIQNGQKNNEIDDLIQADHQEEIRLEIESLLRIVLPEEVTNINEMLYEFQGREDQLLDSLRKMKDRQTESSEKIEELDITQQQQSFSRSNPQAGISPAGIYSNNENGDGQLKSPPELLLNNNSSIEEEDRKLPAATENNMKSYSSLQMDKDEHDLPNQPIEDNISLNDIVDEEIPNSIQTSNDSTNFNDGMSKLKLSNLTTQSDETDDSSPKSESTDNDLLARSLSEETITVVPSKKTTAIVKLRIWDPAKPHQRIKCVTATHILLPYDTNSSKTTNNNGEVGKGEAKKQIKESRKAALIRDQREESRNQMKRLSIVKEEPDKPIERGDSYFESISDGEGELGKLCAAIAKEEEEEGEGSIEEEEDSIDRRINGAKEDVSPLQEEGGDTTNSKQKLQVGTLVGIQLKTSSSTSLPSRPTTTTNITSSGASATSTFSYSGKQQLEWKVGSSINLHNVNFLPISNIPELHYQITNNYTCLKELVLDGLPYNSLQIEEAELLFDAIGNNTSIKRLSMRYSYVNDDYATLFALSLVTNQSLIQLVLEGNEMTTTSAKNFYSVLKKNNDTLRLLDLSCNPIDEDVLDALDQFMEQRALKRTLTNKAEKARRAARGLPPDNRLDDEDDETDGQVTVVCTQSMIDNVIQGDKDDDEYLDELHSLENDNKPYPGEDFRDYMQRMDDIQRSKDESASYHKVLMDNSDRDLDAFQNFRAKGTLADSPEQQNDGGRLSPGNSMGSSITSRSTHKHRDGTDQENGDVVTTTNDDDEGGRRTQLTSNRSNRNVNSSSRNLKQSLGSEEFARGPPALRMSGMEEPSGRVGGSGSPHPYHTLESGGSGSRSGSLDLSQQDYMDPKAREREIRDRLARSGGAIGAYHMDEVAPQRQNRSGGARRGRMGRSASQRAARLAEIEGSGGGGGGGPTRASSRNLINGGMGDEEVLNADIERADDYSAMEMTQMTLTNKIFNKHFASFGLNDRDAGFDRKICIFLAALALALLIMVIVLATR